MRGMTSEELSSLNLSITHDLQDGMTRGADAQSPGHDSSQSGHSESDYDVTSSPQQEVTMEDDIIIDVVSE